MGRAKTYAKSHMAHGSQAPRSLGMLVSSRPAWATYEAPVQKIIIIKKKKKKGHALRATALGGGRWSEANVLGHLLRLGSYPT